MFEIEKENIKEQVTDSVIEIGYEVIFEALGEIVCCIFDGF